IILLIFHNSNTILQTLSFDQTVVNPCPNCCFSDSDRPFINRSVPHEEKILVPLFDIDQENQILGMREAVFFARQLNRTLSIPPFFKKIVLAQSVERLSMPQDIILDPEQLKESGVKTLDWKLLANTCGGKFDQFFVVNQNFNCRVTRRDLWDKSLRLINFNFDKNPYPKVNEDGKCGIENSLPVLKSKNYIAKSGKNIKEDFQTDAKCVLLAYPFENIDFLSIIESERKNSSDDYQELNRTVSAVQIPEFIKKKVSERLTREEIADFTCIELRKRASIRDIKNFKGNALNHIFIKKCIKNINKKPKKQKLKKICFLSKIQTKLTTQLCPKYSTTSTCKITSLFKSSKTFQTAQNSQITAKF
ncbi:unnamed protein product, partial [Oikopleura dioica]